jgi:Secretion system C-terminal sorting domain
MKKLAIGAFMMAAGFAAQASQPRLIIQQIDNHGQVEGKTYRLFCQLEQGQSLQVVYGDANHPLIIRTEGELYNHDFGGNSSSAVNAALAESVPALRYDSWITVGFENSSQNDLWELGMDYTGFASNDQMVVDNGGWFLVPTSAKCQPNQQGLVLLGQFTTNGVVSGNLNLQGKDALNTVWQAQDVSFTTANSQLFGCNDKAASNYSPDAEFHDSAACEYKSASAQPAATSIDSVSSDWSVFPNPLRDNLINIQLNESLASADKATIQVVDQSGKLVFQRDLQSGDILNNRLSISQELSAGTYQIVWIAKGKSSTKTLVVQK